MTSVSSDRRQGLNSSAAIKVPVRVATTANIALTGLQTIDGVALATLDRVLVKDQTTTSENGIYDVDTGNWTRSLDFDGAYDPLEGTIVTVLHGNTYTHTLWMVSTTTPSIGSALAFAVSQLSPADSNNVTFLQAGAGAVARTMQSKERDIVSVKDFGAVGDGITDDAAAIRAAIASGAFELVFPPGTYLCATRLVPATTYPSGMKMRALASSGSRDIAPAGPVIIKYTGTGICFDIQEALGTAQIGGWEWEGMNFYATDGAGGMFSFNDSAFVPTGDATTPNHLCQIQFKACNLIGAGAGATQTGNGIHCNKTFELNIDDQCYIAYWKRGVWLNTGDNCTIRGRFMSNTRHIMTTRRSIFGNSNVIDARYLGILGGSAESRYALHLSDDATVYAPTFELNDATDTGIYINSYNITVHDPIFGFPLSAGSFVELGAGCLDAHIFNPHFTGGPGPLFWDTIAAPTSWDFAAGAAHLQHYTLTVHNPNANVLGTLVPHPRIRVDSPYHDEFAYPLTDATAIPQATASMRLARRTCNAFNYWGLTSGSDMTAGPPSIVADAGAPFGYAIQLAATLQVGFHLYFGTIGKGIENGDVVNVRIYYKMSAVPTAAGDYYIFVGKNNAANSLVALTDSATYAVQNIAYTIAGYAAGDTVSFGLFNGGETVETVNIADISMTITQAAIADTASGVVATVEAEVNKLKAVLRTAGIISHP